MTVLHMLIAQVSHGESKLDSATPVNPDGGVFLLDDFQHVYAVDGLDTFSLLGFPEANLDHLG